MENKATLENTTPTSPAVTVEREKLQIICPTCGDLTDAVAYGGRIDGRCLKSGRDVHMVKVAGNYISAPTRS